jgi:hypothetical protein
MLKRKWLLMLVALVLLLIASRLAISRYFESTWARAYSRIELGMTIQQVEDAIGLPPGYYEGEYPRPPSMGRFVRTPPLRQSGIVFKSRRVDDHKLHAWIGRTYAIWVIFDDQDTAVGSYLLEQYPDSFRESWFSRWLRKFFSY